jgi:hypothetical protein
MKLTYSLCHVHFGIISHRVGQSETFDTQFAAKSKAYLTVLHSILSVNNFFYKFQMLKVTSKKKNKFYVIGLSRLLKKKRPLLSFTVLSE